MKIKLNFIDDKITYDKKVNKINTMHKEFNLKHKILGRKLTLLTAIYAAQPADLVLAFESTNLPLMPKSHSFTVPFSSRRMFDGLTSL